MPVFNEQAAIRRVVGDWFHELDRTVTDFVLFVIDDGSTDKTKSILDALVLEFGERLEVRSRSNRGHGHTCLEGYREAIARGIPYILQIDSDGQCDPTYVGAFWALRDQYDVIYGDRQRDDGARRVLASFVLKSLLRLKYGVHCVDANVPYRLMQTEQCRQAFELISEHFFLVNIALAVLLRMDPRLRHGVIPIRFRERHGGEPSVPLSKFGAKAIQLCRQLDDLLYD